MSCFSEAPKASLDVFIALVRRRVINRVASHLTKSLGNVGACMCVCTALALAGSNTRVRFLGTIRCLRYRRGRVGCLTCVHVGVVNKFMPGSGNNFAKRCGTLGKSEES